MKRELSQTEILDGMADLKEKNPLGLVEVYRVMTNRLLSENAKLTQKQEEISEIPPEILELLKNPSIQVLITPPTALEIEIEEMIAGTRPAPAPYPKWRDKNKLNPMEFLTRHYTQYIEADCLYLDQLRKIDKTLVKALENWCYSQHKEIPLRRERERTDKYITEISPLLKDRIANIGNVLTRRKIMGIK